MSKFIFLAIAIFMDLLQGLVSLALVPIPVIGWGIGIVFTVSITAVGGTVLVLGLGQAGLFRPALMIPTFIVEMLPFLGALPTWTGATLFAIMRKKKGSTQKGAGIFRLFAFPGAKGSADKNARDVPQGRASRREEETAEAEAEADTEPARRPARQQTVDGITRKNAASPKPANDNTPRAANGSGQDILSGRPVRVAA